MNEIKRKDEMEMRDELRDRRKKIETFDELVSFLEYVKDECNYDYGVVPRSIAQASVAVAWYLASEFGITGFQAGFVMWDFIRDWNNKHNECGMKLVDYDDMLYPQHDYKFEKTIASSTWEALQKTAKKNLDEREEHVHPAVKAHWESIVAGKVPFGYVVKDS